MKWQAYLNGLTSRWHRGECPAEQKLLDVTTTGVGFSPSRIATPFPSLTVQRLLEKLEETDNKLRYTAIFETTFHDFRPVKRDTENVVECRIRTPWHFAFWRASPDGLTFFVRDHQEDTDPFQSGLLPGVMLSPVTSAIRVHHCLQHAKNLATILVGGPSDIEVCFTWEGLRGRVLQSFSDDREMYIGNDMAHADYTATRGKLSTDEIVEDAPAVVQRFTEPLYSVFGEAFDKDTVASWIAGL